MGLTMQEKKALTREVSKRYQQAGKKEKTVILNELVKVTGNNRKYLLHKLANWGKTTMVRLDGKTIRLKASPGKRRKGGGRKPKYTGGCNVSPKMGIICTKNGNLTSPISLQE